MEPRPARPEPRFALLVDYGGVLTTPIRDSFAAFADATGVDLARVQEVLASAYRRGTREGMIHDLETGQRREAEIEAEIAASLSAGGIEVEGEGLIRHMFAGMALDERMLAAVGAVRAAGRRTALLSNSWGTSNYRRERFPALFDDVVISGEVGLRKPDPAIFTLAAQRLGVAPSACVFVDDIAANLEPAETLGMAVVLHRDAATTIAALADLLGLPELTALEGPQSSAGAAAAAEGDESQPRPATSA